MVISEQEGDEVISGTLTNEEGVTFEIRDGIADLTWPKELAEIDEETRKTYDQLAAEYDKFADFPFKTFGFEQHDVRLDITQRLGLKPGDKVLEVGGGDGRGAEYILKEIGDGGILFFQELSEAFLKKAKERLDAYNTPVEYATANACYVSFQDNSFDAAHHFGGINTFSDVKRSLSELARVVKPGGKVVVGDEGMGPWLRDTEFGKVMMNSNPLLAYEIPFQDIPLEARDVKVEWIMNGSFFLLEFTVAKGEPTANYHIPIPSQRGGTHWSRYYGNLEGVSDEVKKMAYEAQKKSGLSMHDWLEKIIRENKV